MVKKIKYLIIIIVLLIPIIGKAADKTCVYNNSNGKEISLNLSTVGNNKYKIDNTEALKIKSNSPLLLANHLEISGDISQFRIDDCPKSFELDYNSSYNMNYVNFTDCSSTNTNCYSLQPTKISCGTYGGIEGYYIDNNNNSYSFYFNGIFVYSSSTSECPSNIYYVENTGYTRPEDNVPKYSYTTAKPNNGIIRTTYTKDSNQEIIIKPGTKYDGVKTCQGQPYEYIEECGCMPSALTDLTSGIYNLLKIAAPALLLIIGGFELVKAMTAQDENAIKKAQQKLIQKFVAAAAVFLIFTVVEFLVSIIANDATSIWTCVKYILEGYDV